MNWIKLFKFAYESGNRIFTFINKDSEGFDLRDHSWNCYCPEKQDEKFGIKIDRKN